MESSTGSADTSAQATQTSSMARHEAIPSAFGEVSKRYFTPLFMGLACVIYYRREVADPRLLYKLDTPAMAGGSN